MASLVVAFPLDRLPILSPSLSLSLCLSFCPAHRTLSLHICLRFSLPRRFLHHPAWVHNKNYTPPLLPSPSTAALSLLGARAIGPLSALLRCGPPLYVSPVGNQCHRMCFSSAKAGQVHRRSNRANGIPPWREAHTAIPKHHLSSAALAGSRCEVGTASISPVSGKRLSGHESFGHLERMAYRLKLDDQGRITWHGLIDGEAVVETAEPQSSVWRRMSAWFQKIVPEKQL